ncbi:MAG: hypothetical protein JWL94_803 [Microbacteriaceae bacterium]|jgi:hypothetical protein|nr:hypothetical protein [Microbacteriaceae bacterium]
MAADAELDYGLNGRLKEIATVEQNDESRHALSASELWLFVGVSVAIALVGVLVLAL